MTKSLAIAFAILSIVVTAEPSQARPASHEVVKKLPEWSQIRGYERKVALSDGTHAFIADPHAPVRIAAPLTVVLHKDDILSKVVLPRSTEERSVHFTKVDATHGILTLRDKNAVSYSHVAFDSVATHDDQYRLADVANISIDANTWSLPSDFIVHVQARTIDVHKLDGSVETFDDARIKLVLPKHALRRTAPLQVARE